MMIENADCFEAVPISDAIVSRAWQAFVAADCNLKVETMQSRKWCVLPVAESMISDLDESLLAALSARGVNELLVCFGEGSANAPEQAGWVQLNQQGVVFLQDAALMNSYLLTDRHQQFCCFQSFDDMYLLAGELEFIELVQKCSFKTSLELTLHMGVTFGESEVKPGWIFKKCQRYSGLFPSGITCTPSTVSKEALRDILIKTNILLPNTVEALIEIRDSMRVFSPQTLRELNWTCIPISYPLDDNIFDSVCYAERLADIARDKGHTQLIAFRLEPAVEFNAYQAPITRDGMLAIMALMLKEDIIVTGSDSDFALLSSISGFVLACGPKELLLRIGGHPSDFPHWIYDAALRRLEGEAPQVEAILGEVLLEYMELEEKP